MAKDLSNSIRESIKELTFKEKGFVKDYVKTGNATEAIVNNYDVKDRIVAKSMGSENLAKPYIKEAIKSIADKIPDDKLLEVHLEGLEASDKIYNKDGEVLIEKPDYAVRHKYLESGYKLKGLYVDKIGNPDGSPLRLTVFMPEKTNGDE